MTRNGVSQLSRKMKLTIALVLFKVPVGYCSFADGISKLKQVIGCDHHLIQQYIICVVASTVRLCFLAAIHALLNFHYLIQIPVVDEQVLTKMDSTLGSISTNMPS